MSQPLAAALPQLAERLAAAQRIFVCLDFDGTLVPIADRPDEVRLPAPMRDLLRALTQCDRVILGIISGRERAEVEGLVDVPGIVTVGNHGLEIAGPGLMFLEPTAAQFLDQVTLIDAEFESRLRGIPGTIIENKGLTLALHYRMVPEDQREDFKRTVHNTLANASHPFLLREGRMVYEIRPRAYWNKGHAITWLRDHLDGPDVLTIYIGDDNTDEDAFAAIPDGITIKVGESAGTAAMYHVNTPRDVHDFLAWLLDRLGREGEAPAEPRTGRSGDSAHA